MLVSMLAMSAGLHLLQPVGASIVIGLSDADNRGTRLGQAAAVSTLFTAPGYGARRGCSWTVFRRSTK